MWWIAFFVVIAMAVNERRKFLSDFGRDCIWILLCVVMVDYCLMKTSETGWAIFWGIVLAVRLVLIVIDVLCDTEENINNENK